MLVSKTEFHVTEENGNVERYPKNFPKDDLPAEHADLVGDHMWRDDEEGAEIVPMEGEPVAPPPEAGLDTGPTGEDGTPAEANGGEPPHLGDQSEQVNEQIQGASTVDQRRSAEDLEKLTSAELKSIAEQAEITGYKSLNKAELIDAIVAHEDGLGGEDDTEDEDA